MKVRRVRYTELSRDDIGRIYDWLAAVASPAGAYSVTDRLLDFI